MTDRACAAPAQGTPLNGLRHGTLTAVDGTELTLADLSPPEVAAEIVSLELHAVAYGAVVCIITLVALLVLSRVARRYRTKEEEEEEQSRTDGEHDEVMGDLEEQEPNHSLLQNPAPSYSLPI
eukprot:5942834-Prymnesium_polylepis.1